MKISYDAPIPKKNGNRSGKWMGLLRDFEKSTHEVMCLDFDSAKEALSARSALISSNTRNEFGYVVKVRDKSVYVCKGGSGERKEKGDGRT